MQRLAYPSIYRSDERLLIEVWLWCVAAI